MVFSQRFTCLALDRVPKGMVVTFNRPEAKNSITPTFLAELDLVLSHACTDAEINYLLLRGSGGFFCTGLDFATFASAPEAQARQGQTALYMALLKKLASIPRIVIAVVEGKVMAGGVGIAAAADLIYAAPSSEFVLSEALWGLLPSCVTPFLIRRVGYQRAYRMTLTTSAIDGSRANDWGLVDELSAQPEQAAKRALPRLARLDSRTVGDMKRFFRRMWFLDEAMEQAAIAETERLLAEPRIQTNIEAFVQRGALPWQG